MVAVAQLAEHLSVEQDVAGSSPVSHPKNKSNKSQTYHRKHPTVHATWGVLCIKGLVVHSTTMSDNKAINFCLIKKGNSMTLQSIPTYIPIKDAAKKYGYVLADLKRLAQSGKIKAVKLPNGDMVVSETSVKEKLKKEDLPEYKKHKDLAKNPIWLSEAERIYEVSTQTLSRWVKAGYISKIGLDGNRVLLNEQDVAYCAEIYKKRGGQGKRIFAEDGTPYKSKTAPLVE
jgi:hypothetical protein